MYLGVYLYIDIRKYSKAQQQNKTKRTINEGVVDEEYKTWS